MTKIYVTFIDKKTEEKFNSLNEKKFEYKQIYSSISKVINCLKEKPDCGIKIQHRLWPKSYDQFGITNLWKINLPNAYRIIYTIENNNDETVCFIIEWISHKEYDRRFGY